MKKWFASLVMITSLVFLNESCKKYHEDELQAEGELCTSDTISFSRHIAPIINNNCMPCHNSLHQDGSVVLETYDDITNYTLNGMLLGVIRHDDGYEEMPANASKLSDCKIRAFEIWINQGALNN